MNNPKYIIVHCTDASYRTNKNQFGMVEAYHKSEDFPKSSLGYHVGYHRLITGGLNYKCRLDTDVGAHCNNVVNGLSLNFQSLGVCIGFDGDVEMPTATDTALMVAQIKEWQMAYDIPNSRVMFHRDFKKEKTCPGSLITRAWLEKEMGWNNPTSEPAKPVRKQITEAQYSALMATLTSVEQQMRDIIKVLHNQ